jgi:Tol biopolymer transport system component
VTATALAAVLMLAVPAGTATSAAAPQRWAPAAIASDQYESTPTFSPDGRELYFMRSTPQFSQWRILHSRCGRQGWSTPQPVAFAATAPALDADPFVSFDGQRLYFISTRQNRDGGDQLDIWRVQKNRDGGWDQAQRLPEPVNSSGSELMPRETPDGRLYFGSDRPGGQGQGDIYVATPQADGGWSVRNLGAPVNTPGFEYEADISRDGSSLVVVADRGTRSHLYRYRREAQGWTEQGRIAADDAVFQVGPLHSPDATRLLFAQRDGARSGELFVSVLAPAATSDWPPRCAD